MIELLQGMGFTVDIAATFIVGYFIVPYVYQPIKQQLKLSGEAAYWVGYGFSLIVAVLVNLAFGAISIGSFPGFQADPVEVGIWLGLQAGIVFKTANAVYYEKINPRTRAALAQ